MTASLTFSNNLSWPKQEAMEKYLSELLAAGLVRPSSSTVGVGFFFVNKRMVRYGPA